MPLSRRGRSGFVAGGVIAAAVALGAVVAQPWVSESGSAQVQAGSASPRALGATEVVETGIALHDHVAAVTEFQGDLVAVTGGGEVVRSRDGRAWQKVPATGFTPRSRARRESGEACAGDSVRGVTARNGLLVAVGAQAVPPEPGDEHCDARLKLWVSRDAATWSAVDPVGLAPTDTLDTVVADTSGILAFGYSRAPQTGNAGDQEEDDEEHGRGLQLWRTADGITWETVPTDGLSKPTEYKYQSVNSVAVRGDGMLAALGVECAGCFDDHVVALWRSGGVSNWQELAFSGLDALDQANSDIVPAVAATNQGYMAFASVGRDHDDDRTPTVWTSTDGARWDATELLGPPPSDGAMDAATAWSRGVVAVDNTRRGLVVWRIEAR